MAGLNLNRPDFGGLRALAGNRLPVNRQPSLYEQFMKGAQQGQQLALNRERMDLRRQIADQNALMAQEKLAIAKQNAGSLQDYRNRDLEMRQQQIEAKDRQQQMKAMLDQRTQQEEDALEQRGAMAGTYILGFQNAQNDDEKELIKQQVIQNAANRGILQEEEAKTLLTKSPEEVYQVSMLDLMLTDKAKSLKALAGKKEGAGPLAQERQPLSAATKTQTQKKAIYLKDSLGKLRDLGNTYAEEYLTTMGKVKGFAGKWSSKLGLGQEELEKFTENRTKFLAKTSGFFSQYLKEMTGVQFGMKEFETRKKEMINAEDSPAEFKGKFNMLVDYMQRSLKTKNELLSKGLEVGTPEFEESFSVQMGEHTRPNTFQGKPLSRQDYMDTIDKYTAQGHTKEQIDEYLRKNP